jgi:hypothetical protein
MQLSTTFLLLLAFNSPIPLQALEDSEVTPATFTSLPEFLTGFAHNPTPGPDD